MEGTISMKTKLNGIFDEALSLQGKLSQTGSLDGSLSNLALRGFSAYQEAVLSGFTGTREQWISSLHGKEVEIRENNRAIEWKYNTDSDWRFLIDLAPTRDYSMLINKPTLNGQDLENEISDTIFSSQNALTNSELEALLR